MNTTINTKRNRLTMTARQVVFLLLLALITALGSNALRSTHLPLVGDWRVATQFRSESGESMVITLESAAEKFNAGSAVFMDARNSDQYEEGHIRGAISLPWYEVEERFMEVIPTIPPDAHIITYCDGETCRLSHDLALFLHEMGFQVNVLVNGWSLWKESGLPVE